MWRTQCELPVFPASQVPGAQVSPGDQHTDHWTVGRLSKQAAERDDRRDASEVEEDDRRQTLQVEPVNDVAAVVTIATANIQQQPTEQSGVEPPTQTD